MGHLYLDSEVWQMEQVATMVVVREAWRGFEVGSRPVDESCRSVLHMTVQVVETSV